MTDKEQKLIIQTALKALRQPNFSQQALALFAALGYNTSRQSPFPQKTYTCFKESFLGWDSKFNEAKALTAEWQSVDLLFQLSKTEVSGQQGLFDTRRVDNTIIETYLFFAIELAQADYSRTALARITREINKVFPMPVMIVFKHGRHVTISVIDRRLNKKDQQKDVLEKVTFIKDISIESPHRAHVEILFDLSFAELQRIHRFTNFVELHHAWQKTLDTRELNKRFYRELSNWYFWAVENVSFPNDVANAKDNQVFNAENVIRLLTRLIFIWFIKEKNLIPERIFDEREVNKLLKGFREKNSTVYYRAILQNLFFATLNQKIEARAFATDGSFVQNKINYGIKNLYRYAADFAVTPEEVIRLFADVPFLNGGLFDCLDSEDKTGRVIYLDGFSRNPKKRAKIPDALFFAKEQSIDLSEVYGDKRRQNEKVKGLFEIFNHYKFTVVENTPIEEEVALDPELLGRVFENLLASYNPETQTTARKQTGSFYTPREIVNYMVDESLVAYLNTNLSGLASDLSGFQNLIGLNTETRLRHLLAYNDAPPQFSEAETDTLITAIDSVKILDPACGSGAFPMGILHKLVHLLHKLDPQNQRWKERQLEKAMTLDDAVIRDNLIDDIETAFANNELDYGRKLYLIENCIYGVDIQPIATQISKLRFFISLIVDQQADRARDNFGIRPLPNLETKFVAANTLIGLEKPQVQLSLFDSQEIKTLEGQLKAVRHRLFSAKSPADKRKLRADDQTLREKMGALLVANGWGNESARRLAGWDPYDQHTSSPFFDPEWMFGVSPPPPLNPPRERGGGGGEGGFDVVIGNPPYMRVQTLQLTQPEFMPIYRANYKSATGSFDIYALFVETGYKLLNKNGQLSYILPHKFFQATFGVGLRKILTERKALRQIVRFGAEQVFDEATTYTCLLFLAAQPQKIFDIFEIRSLQSGNEVLLAALNREKHPDYEHSQLDEPTDDNWDFTVGENNKVMQKITQCKQTLGDVTRKIFVTV
jgi:type I restriction-modification system DNA methylase subunit